MLCEKASLCERREGSVERESELVKVTGTTVLLGQSRGSWKVWMAQGPGWQGLAWGGKWWWSSSVFHLCLPREHPAAVALPARGSELAARTYLCTAHSLLSLPAWRAPASTRTITGVLHAA